MTRKDKKMIYALILFAKIVEVSLGTVRTVLITKGERKIGAAIGFFEVLLWMYIAANVLTNITSDPLKAVFYALGFALGNYFGSMIEEFIGIGLSEIVVIVKDEHGGPLSEYLRRKNFAVTMVEGIGMSKSRRMLFLFTQRKRVKEAVTLIKEKQANAVITVSETKPLYGGYGLLRK